MQINFVSLFDAIRAIAPGIEISEQEVGFYSAAPANDGLLWAMLARRPARECFQESRAAVQLLDCLFNHSAALRWFDIALTGFPLQSEDARKEGRNELVRFVNQERTFKAGVERMRSPFSRWHDNSQPPPPLDFPKMPRSGEIGFDRVELIELLNRKEIPHNLGHLPDSVDGKAEANTSALSILATSPTQAEPSSSSQRRRRKFRGPEAEALSMAEERARDPDEYRSVWAAFVELARGKNPPYPILGYIDSEDVVQLTDAKTDEVRYFTKEHMRKRIK